MCNWWHTLLKRATCIDIKYDPFRQLVKYNQPGKYNNLGPRNWYHVTSSGPITYRYLSKHLIYRPRLSASAVSISFSRPPFHFSFPHSVSFALFSPLSHPLPLCLSNVHGCKVITLSSHICYNLVPFAPCLSMCINRPLEYTQVSINNPLNLSMIFSLVSNKWY